MSPFLPSFLSNFMQFLKLTVRSKVDYSLNVAVSLPDQTFTEYHENEGIGNYL